MSKKKPSYKTIKEAAEALLMQVSYTDVYGRKVGLTYKAILDELHKLFPSSRTSLRYLREIKCHLNNSTSIIPARRRSTKVLARDYARALLIWVDTDYGLGHSFDRIARLVKKKFPEQPRLTSKQLTGLSFDLSKKQKFQLPPRE